MKRKIIIGFIIFVGWLFFWSVWYLPLINLKPPLHFVEKVTLKDWLLMDRSTQNYFIDYVKDRLK